MTEVEIVRIVIEVLALTGAVLGLARLIVRQVWHLHQRLDRIDQRIDLARTATVANAAINEQRWAEAAAGRREVERRLAELEAGVAYLKGVKDATA